MAIILTQPGTNSTGWASPVNANFQTTQDWLNNGAVKAWVNFNGTTATIRSSCNVASVARNSTGNYTITFSNAFADINFVGSGTVCDDNAYVGLTYEMGTFGQYRTATSVRIFTYAIGLYAPRDFSMVSWMFIGQLA